MMGDSGLTFGCGQNSYLSGSSGLNATVDVTLELQFVGMLCYYSNLLFKDLLNEQDFRNLRGSVAFRMLISLNSTIHAIGTCPLDSPENYSLILIPTSKGNMLSGL